jgi:hypothetical protein
LPKSTDAQPPARLARRINRLNRQAVRLYRRVDAFAQATYMTAAEFDHALRDASDEAFAAAEHTSGLDALLGTVAALMASLSQSADPMPGAPEWLSVVEAQRRAHGGGSVKPQ